MRDSFRARLLPAGKCAWAGTDGRPADELGFFTGVVEQRGPGWRLRDLHWSVPTPPAAVP